MLRGFILEFINLFCILTHTHITHNERQRLLSVTDTEGFPFVIYNCSQGQDNRKEKYTSPKPQRSRLLSSGSKIFSCSNTRTKNLRNQILCYLSPNETRSLPLSDQKPSPHSLSSVGEDLWDACKSDLEPNSTKNQR